MLSLGETGQWVHGICMLFLKTACEYTIVPNQKFNKNEVMGLCEVTKGYSRDRERGRYTD